MSSLDDPVARHRVANDNKTPPQVAAVCCSAVAGDFQQPDARPIFCDSDKAESSVPNYLRDTYTWAYLRPSSVRLLDRFLAVNTILWGNYPRLLRAALAELRPGQRVYQPACVYGDFSSQVLEALGPDGHLDVGDVAPVQVENCRRKLRDYDNARVQLHDAAVNLSETYDVVCSFFLLHEVPETYKHSIVDTLLDAVEPGGKVVFVDYHGPHWAHPLKWFMRFINDTLEPFANALWANEIASYASQPDEYSWSKETYFGGLYQKVVAERQP